MTNDDSIRLNGLSVTSRVGVPDQERSLPQHLRLNITLWPANPLSGLQDQVRNTVDYYEVSRLVRKKAAEGERRLIETLAEDLVDLCLAVFPLRQVRIEVLKFILPDTDSVSVTLTKQKPGPAV
jgi:dihydroneopterin aldolase